MAKSGRTKRRRIQAIKGIAAQQTNRKDQRMETFTITRDHVDWNSRYIGPEPKFDGNVLIKGGLGHVRFKYLSVQGSIIVEPGSSVSAVKGIKAGVSVSGGVLPSPTQPKGIKMTVDELIKKGIAAEETLKARYPRQTTRFTDVSINRLGELLFHYIVYVYNHRGEPEKQPGMRFTGEEIEKLISTKI